MHRLMKHAEKQVNALHSKVRSAVSRDKFRFQDGSFDLDLTYITNRIIAMGFPGTSFEKAWRNSKDEVAACLQQYHDHHYLVVNVSERVYDPTPLQHVAYFGWPDHHPPSLSRLLACVQDIDIFLQADPLNVVAIHCMAGRGRTGTVIAAYLLYIKMFNTPTEALDFFATRRSTTKEGVQVPSQIRYVEYFHSLLVATAANGPIQLPPPKTLKLNRMLMRPIPPDFDLTGDFTPSVVIECFTALPPVKLFTNQSTELRSYNPKDAAVLVDTLSTPLVGDIMIRVYSDAVLDTLTERPLFQFAFHTSFIQNYIMDVPRMQLDSGGAGSIKDERIPLDFTVRLIFTE